jgi:hypothetical protein
MWIAPGLLISLLLLAGFLLYLAGWVGLWIEAFRHSILWGLLVVAIPAVTVAFALFHWETARFPTLCLLTGIGLVALSYVLSSISGVPIPDH